MKRSFAAMILMCSVLSAGLLLASPAALAQEVSIHQVYEAAEAGKFIEAQKLMDQVLAAHPNSPKAHFIEAELLAKQGKMARAATELATAERLGPDLKFAKPEALQRLKAVIAAARPAAKPAAKSAESPAAVQAPVSGASAGIAASEPPAAGPPWGLLLGIGALVLLAVMFFKRKAAQAIGPAGMGGAYNGGAPQYPQGGAPGQYPPGAVPPQYGGAAGYGAPAAPAGGVGGMGSGILGGLATGAALGAGMVAGQALAHRFTDSGQSGHEGANRTDGGSASGLTGATFQNDTPPSGYDMGGSDFGVTDSGSWDSGSDSGGGGNDWD